MANNTIFFVLTGDPGVGKTTLVKKICSTLNKRSVKTVGFFTEEVRQNLRRQGFDVVSLTGERGRLAREQDLLPIPSKFAVGKYGVLVQEFEDVALHSMQMPEPNNKLTVLVIDEIGKMEFFSLPFKSKIKDIFSSGSNIVLATIPIRKSDPLIESIRNNSKGKVWIVTRENRSFIHEQILKDMLSALNV